MADVDRRVPGQHVQSACDAFARSGELGPEVLVALGEAIRIGISLGVPRAEAERLVAAEFVERARLVESLGARQLAQAGRELAEIFKTVN
jgi:hypothetical protein